jgi:hypothetical protein
MPAYDDVVAHRIVVAELATLPLAAAGANLLGIANAAFFPREPAVWLPAWRTWLRARLVPSVSTR